MKYKVQFRKGKIAASVIKRNLEDAKKYPKETWRTETAERFRRVDCFYDFDSSCMGCHGSSSGPCNHEEIVKLVTDHLRDWLKKDRHAKEDDGYYEVMCKPVDKRPKRWKPEYVKHRPINRKSVYFHCDFPEVLDRDGFFRILAELKGATRDKTGGLWK